MIPSLSIAVTRPRLVSRATTQTASENQLMHNSTAVYRLLAHVLEHDCVVTSAATLTSRVFDVISRERQMKDRTWDFTSNFETRLGNRISVRVWR
ncbi:predicted protein [Plenodomus lingam JN3]|uniref:Predicted protein n=1 Tax=Leptosphaeria maculans (strain JN3 / isolate v23.1.3 / race Av1-4-5-6-7-8) TaxID=985895 RepID=E4ZW63_LEPMJ|nr:predicted protein [Plenodomus lingam JN3]CBX95839.1 predicted protein [Plenodomus lingam JN3]